MSELPKVCLVGAGASGITTARSLAKRGIPFDWFDRGDRVGGLWVFDSASGTAAAYRGLHINVSRQRMEFDDYPVPDNYPLFPHHSQIARYFSDYVERWGLTSRLHLNTGVQSAQLRDDELWEVTLDSGEERLYDALVVASGHHSVPRIPPSPPGDFDGEQIHSHAYRDDSVLRDRDVVVVGCGNSAMDLAVEASYAARSAQLSVRRGAHVLPKVMFGFPYDQVPGLEFMLGRGIGRGRMAFQIPWRIRQMMMAVGHRLTVGRMSDYGLPNPDRPFGAVHPTISPRILERLQCGRITPRPAIERFEGDHVRFADGSRARADLIVWCTGYNVEFPFLDHAVMPVEDNRVDLYKHVFRPGIPNLAFIGLVQPGAGSTMQIAEGQGRWVAAYLAGDYALPSERAMQAEIAQRRRVSAKRHVPSARHTFQVEQFEYLWRLRDELRAGRRRARRQGAAITPRAAQRDLRSTRYGSAESRSRPPVAAG